MWYDDDVVAAANGFGDELLEGGNVLGQVLGWVVVADRGQLACVHSVAGGFELGDDKLKGFRCMPIIEIRGQLVSGKYEETRTRRQGLGRSEVWPW